MPDIVHQITVQAPADKVYAALTSEHGLKSWWTVDSEADAKPGGKARFGFYNRAVVFDMTFGAMESGKQVALSCHEGPPGWAGTDLLFELGPDEQQGGTLVQFRHGPFADMDAGYAMVNTTWGQLMGTLKAYTESGTPMPLFTA